MDINKLLNNRRLLQATIGVSKKEFDALLAIFTKTLEETAKNKKRKRDIGGGRRGNIKEPHQKLFYILFYLKTHPTFDVAAYIFGSSKTRTQEWTRDMLPILEKTLGRTFVLPKRKINGPEEFLEAFPEVKEVLIDGMERPTIRSKKKKTQNKHYSGKKKRHTRKGILVTDTKKRILALTKMKHGKVHDKKLTDKSIIVHRIPKNIGILGDTGFQGIAKQHPNVLLPKKKPKGGELTQEEKEMNRLISSIRVRVEHAIGGIKRFRAVADIFRHKKGQDDSITAVCAGLWNFHLLMN